MIFNKSSLRRQLIGCTLALISLVVLSACSTVTNTTKAISTKATNPQSPTPAVIASSPNTTPSITPTRTPTLTPTPDPSPTVPTPTPTPVPLQIFQAKGLYDSVFPVEYIRDTCVYLQQRWNPNNALPGTVVVPIMYHGVRKAGGTVTDNITVTQKYFMETMVHAKELGFETITIQELVDFLHNNTYIPPRSMLLVIDDRRLGTVKEHFLPVLEENDWTLVMAYITGIISEQEWQEIKDVLASGRVEIQAHGFMHNGETYFTEYTSDEIIQSEIYEPIEAFKENLDFRPTAFIWPGGNFTEKTVKAVRKAGYDLGFTAYARGPLMFNWVPLGEDERAMDDPLMVLPRYWSTSAYKNLDDAVAMSDAASEFAKEQRQEEFSWYQDYCTDFPPIPQPLEVEMDEAGSK